MASIIFRPWIDITSSHGNTYFPVTSISQAKVHQWDVPIHGSRIDHIYRYSTEGIDRDPVNLPYKSTLPISG